ncbi:MAG: hypothetical protein Q8R60_03050 [Mycobacteriales bacterium]|nr:hypothetical protein [Mycobacteriales bacterium]
MLDSPLTSAPCRSACDWQAVRPPVPLWACVGCGSQWQPGEAWAPRQLDGSWPPGVREARDTAQRG